MEFQIPKLMPKVEGEIVSVSEKLTGNSKPVADTVRKNIDDGVPWKSD